jgi:hypothetical protein
MRSRFVWLTVLCLAFAAVNTASAEDPNEVVVDPNEVVVDPNEAVVDPNEAVVDPNEVEPEDPKPALVSFHPSDGAINRSIDTQLTWAASEGAASFNVYFGVSEADVLAGADVAFQGNQKVTTFDPSTLDFGTTYYWCIDIYDADGNIFLGRVASFTTRPEGVDMASNPSPVDGAQGVTDSPLLIWDSGLAAVEHAVYLAANEAAVTAGTVAPTLTADAFFAPAALDWNKTYYWRVDEIDEDTFVIPGPVWSFKVADYVVVADGPIVAEYDNMAEPFATEVVVAEFKTPQDWTKNGVNYLQLEIMGQNPVVEDVNDVIAVLAEDDPNEVPADVVDPNEVPVVEDPLAQRYRPAPQEEEPVVEPNDVEEPVVLPMPNASASLFVVVYDSDGKFAEVAHSGNPNVVGATDWQTWMIRTSELVGIDLKKIVKVVIDVRNDENGGLGVIQVRNVRVIRPFVLAVEKTSAVIQKGGTLLQTTGHTIVEGEQFELTVDATMVNGGFSGGASNLMIALYYDNEGKGVTVASKSTQLPNDTKNSLSVTFATKAAPAAVGNKLGIQITNVSPITMNVRVDDVRLKVK